MFELFVVLLFFYLVVNAIGLMLRLTWGLAKIAAGILIALAFPALVVCFLFVGGIALLIPVAMIVIAVGIVKACIEL